MSIQFKCTLKVLFSLGTLTSLFATDSPTDWVAYQQNILGHQSAIHGWCTEEKATQMMNLVKEVSPKICVEIGVFGGSSIYPTAAALKYLGKGMVYAVDPWETDDCLVGYDPNDPNYAWWSQVNLEEIYLGFLQMLDTYNLVHYCMPMRTTGKAALALFRDGSIDILHIDGNNTEEEALADGKMFLPKVKSGGYIWFDDVNWKTTKSAIEYLTFYCDKDEVRSTNMYYLF